jgi:hypothetical protein
LNQRLGEVEIRILALGDVALLFFFLGARDEFLAPFFGVRLALVARRRRAVVLDLLIALAAVEPAARGG